MNLQIVQIDSPAFNAIINEVVSQTIDQCKKEFGKTTDEALTQSEAMALLKIDSPQKMKKLRDAGKITAKKEGREYKYSKRSIEKYIISF